MAERHICLVFSEPFQPSYGDDEYNQIMMDAYHDWYNNVHMQEMLAVPGYVSCQRYELAPIGSFAQTTQIPSRYCAIYEMEGDLESILERLGPATKSWAGRIPAAARPETWEWWIFSELGPRVYKIGREPSSEA